MSSSRSLLERPGGCKNSLADLNAVDKPDKPETSPPGIVRQGTNDALEDAALIRSMQTGCEESFDLLFARYWKLVFAIAWKILRERCEAEDVVQDVFLAIYQRSNHYDPGRGSVRTWIAQFAYYKALVRRKASHTKAAANLDELKEFESALLRFGPADSVLERAAFVKQCLAILSPRQRRILELVHFDGYTLTEAATILKQSLANTRNLYYRGLNSLRIQLQGSHIASQRIKSPLSGALSEPGGEPLILTRTCRP